LARKPVDWENLEKDYRSGAFATKAAMAERYACSTTAINKKAKKERWPEYEPSSEVLAKVSKNPPAKPHEKILGPIAKRKMQEITAELGEYYSSVDEPLIVGYGWTYEMYINESMTLAKENAVIESPKTGSKYINPRFNAVMMLQKNIVTLANQLGLSIASRKKLGIDFEDKDGKRTGSLFDMVAKLSEGGEDIEI